MTREDQARGRRRLTATRRGRLQLAAGGVVLLLLAGVAARVAPALADADQIEGSPLPADQLTAVVAAALSCPVLTPPRLAGQLMALTVARPGGGTAALIGDADWATWKPGPDARRDDPADTVFALAHQTCALAGEARAARIAGDQWELAVAAQRGGLAAVRTAQGVPGDQREFVDRAAGYAAWYTGTEQFSADAIEEAGVAPAVAGAVAVPAALVAPIAEAGRRCPGVTPARIAAQLRAASNFAADLRTGKGSGIAQFSAPMWNQYAGAAASVYDARAAIAVLGLALCDLTSQFSALGAGDPYTLALGAFQWGADTIRRAGGLPRTTVPQLATTVLSHVPEYEKDARLTVSQQGAGPRPSVPAPAAPSAPSTPEPTVTSSAPPTTPAAGTAKKTTAPAVPKKLFNPAKTYLIRNVHAGAVIQMPGDDVTSPAGTHVEMWGDQEAQDRWWKVSAAADGEHVVITNTFLGMSLGVDNGSTDDYAPIVVLDTDRSDPNQQWTLEDAGGGELFITNRNSGKLMELHGDDVAPAGGTWDGYNVQQWSKQAGARDQRWKLVG